MLFLVCLCRALSSVAGFQPVRFSLHMAGSCQKQCEGWKGSLAALLNHGVPSTSQNSCRVGAGRAQIRVHWSVYIRSLGVYQSNITPVSCTIDFTVLCSKGSVRKVDMCAADHSWTLNSSCLSLDGLTIYKMNEERGHNKEPWKPRKADGFIQLLGTAVTKPTEPSTQSQVGEKCLATPVVLEPLQISGGCLCPSFAELQCTHL